MTKLRKIISYMPRPLKVRVLRHLTSMPSVPSPEFVFKIADSISEFEQISLNKWHCLPSTTTLLCKSGEKIIASVSLIADSGFGMPADQQINLGRFRQKGLRILEISGHTPGEHSIPLFKFLYEYASKVVRADALIISSDREMADDLSSVFLFEPIEEGKLLHNSKFESSEIGQVLFLHGIEAKYAEVYGHRKKNNLHQYLFQNPDERFQIPRSKYQFSTGPALSTEEFRHLFMERNDLLSTLSAREQFFISEHYKIPIAPENVPYQRSSPRIAVRYRASVVNFSSSRIRSGEVHQVALHGLALKITNMDFKVGEKISVIIDMEDNTRMKIQGNIVWTSEHSAGVKLESLPAAWREFNEYAWSSLKSELRPSA